jgi:hypothetical protein
MKMCGKSEVQLLSFVTSALDEAGGWLDVLAALLPDKGPRYPGPQSLSAIWDLWRKEEFLLLLESKADSLFMQSVACIYVV